MDIDVLVVCLLAAGVLYIYVFVKLAKYVQSILLKLFGLSVDLVEDLQKKMLYCISLSVKAFNELFYILNSFIL